MRLPGPLGPERPGDDERREPQESSRRSRRSFGIAGRSRQAGEGGRGGLPSNSRRDNELGSKRTSPAPARKGPRRRCEPPGGALPADRSVERCPAEGANRSSVLSRWRGPSGGSQTIERDAGRCAVDRAKDREVCSRSGGSPGGVRPTVRTAEVVRPRRCAPPANTGGAPTLLGRVPVARAVRGGNPRFISEWQETRASGKRLARRGEGGASPGGPGKSGNGSHAARRPRLACRGPAGAGAAGVAVAPRSG